MNTLDTKELLGYTIDIFEIEEFKEYYDENINRFNDFSRSAFLKAISIPPAYFMEQPEETREELLCNKLELVKTHKKYEGLSIIVVSQGNQILNATKIKSYDVETKFEAISSIEDVEGIVWTRHMIKDGYICGYIVCGTVSKEGFNRALFIDLPVLFNKPTILHEGFIELANPRMDIEKDMIYYTDTQTVDYLSYQHIALALEDAKEQIDINTKSVNDTESVDILREPTQVILELVDEKVVPKSLMSGLINYLDKKVEDGYILTDIRVLKALIAFDENVKNLKAVNNLRSSKDTIQRLYKAEEESEGVPT